MKKASPPISRELAAHIKYLMQRGDLFQQQIAAMLGVNQGRISEVKHGQRHPDVPPQRGSFPA